MINVHQIHNFLALHLPNTSCFISKMSKTMIYRKPIIHLNSPQPRFIENAQTFKIGVHLFSQGSLLAPLTHPPPQLFIYQEYPHRRYCVRRAIPGVARKIAVGREHRHPYVHSYSAVSARISPHPMVLLPPHSPPPFSLLINPHCTSPSRLPLLIAMPHSKFIISGWRGEVARNYRIYGYLLGTGMECIPSS